MRISLMTLSLFPSLRAQAWIALHQGIYSHLWWSEKVTQSCPTLCDPVDCSLPGSSVHGIFQARILEWVAISFSRRSSWPMDWTRVTRIVGRCFIIWATREVPLIGKSTLKSINCVPHPQQAKRRNSIFIRNMENIERHDWISRDEKQSIWDENYTWWE